MVSVGEMLLELVIGGDSIYQHQAKLGFICSVCSVYTCYFTSLPHHAIFAHNTDRLA